MEHAKQIAESLDLEESAITPFELVQITRQGIPARSLKKLLNIVHINQEEFANYSGIKYRTLVRRFEKNHENLNPQESEKALRLARIYFDALDVFRDGQKAREWLKRPNRSLNNEPPLALLDSDIGTEQVIQVLGRIRDGVYS